MKVIICDGSSKGNGGASKIGVVIWERFSGTSSARRVAPTKTISKDIGNGTNNDAEWKALIEALEWVNSQNDNDPVFIYSDSMLVVEQANNRWKVKQPNMKIYKDKVDELVEKMDIRHQEITLSWLPRQLTMLADKET